jgi:FMN phosphatase YigB (HAD superfamily)
MRTEDHTGRRQWEARLGLAEYELDRAVFHSEAANRATLGDGPEDAIWQSVADRFQLSADQIAALQDDFWSGDRLDVDLVALLASLRPRYQTAILSNYWPNGRELIGRINGLATIVDTIFISSEERLAKPDARLYQRVAERLSVQPEAIVLVDDFIANIDGARAAGWQTIHYQAGMDVRAALEQLGVTATSGAPP